MSWKQQLAEAFHQRKFEDFNSDEQSIAEKAVELYENQINAKRQNEREGVSGVPENKGGEKGYENTRSFKEWKRRRPPTKDT